MKKLAIILGVVALAFAFAYSCKKESPAPKPEDTIDAYYKAILADDLDTALLYVYPEANDRASTKALITNNGEKEFHSGYLGYETLKTIYDYEANEVSVLVRVTKDDNTTQEKTHKMFQQNGAWYIVNTTK